MFTTESKTPNTLTVSRLAKLSGKSPRTVTRDIEAGAPTDSVESYKKWRAANTKNVGRPEGARNTSGSLELVRKRSAVLLGLKIDREKRRLVPIAAVQQFIRSYASEIRRLIESAERRGDAETAGELREVVEKITREMTHGEYAANPIGDIPGGSSPAQAQDNAKIRGGRNRPANRTPRRKKVPRRPPANSGITPG